MSKVAINLKINERLYNKIKQVANLENRSISGQIRHIFTDWIKKYVFKFPKDECGNCHERVEFEVDPIDGLYYSCPLCGHNQYKVEDVG